MVDVSLLISGVSLLVAIVVAVSNLKRGQTTEDKQEATEMTTLIVKLETINNGVNEIKSDMRNMRDDMTELRERVIRVEESTKSAHHRLDGLLEGHPE